MTHRVRPNKLLLLSAMISCLALGTGLFSIATGDAGFVGSEKCKDCHAAASATHTKSVHAHAWEGKGNSCESCHGPAGAHVDNPTLDNIISFGNKSKLTADKQSKPCLECHSSSTVLAFWDNGEHKRGDIACDDCHGIHTSGKSIAKDPEVCLNCHKDVRSQINKFSHHPIIEGKVKCADCHNPHGTLRQAMLKDENNNQLCYKCHADKRGPYVWQHAPVEENCLICHGPHGTKTAKLLNEKMPMLCQNCHNDSGHPSNLYSGNLSFTSGTVGGSNPNRFVGQSCANCHNMIHGSTTSNSTSTNSKRLIR